MKKISKILLPLGTIAAMSTAITPLVSCSDGRIDLINYHPDPTTVLEAGPMTEQQATDALFSGENAKALVEQDILNYLSWTLLYELDPALKLFGFNWVGRVQKASCWLSNLNLTYDKDNHVARLSGTIRLKADCVMVNPKIRTEKIGSYTIETKHDIYNVPYKVVRTEDSDWGNEYWTSYFKQADLQGDDTWHVDRYYYGNPKYDNPETEWDGDDDTTTFDKTNIGDAGNFEELTLIRWWSYYLYKVEKQN